MYECALRGWGVGTVERKCLARARVNYPDPIYLPDSINRSSGNGQRPNGQKIAWLASRGSWLLLPLLLPESICVLRKFRRFLGPEGSKSGRTRTPSDLAAFGCQRNPDLTYVGTGEFVRRRATCSNSTGRRIVFWTNLFPPSICGGLRSDSRFCHNLWVRN